MTILPAIFAFVLLAVFVVFDYFLIKFIKKNKEMPLKKFYLFSSLSFFIVMLSLFVSLVFVFSILVEYGGTDVISLGNFSIFLQFFMIMLCALPILQSLFMIGAYIKYMSSVLCKRWRHVFISFGIASVAFVTICSMLSQI